MNKQDRRLRGRLLQGAGASMAAIQGLEEPEHLSDESSILYCVSLSSLLILLKKEDIRVVGVDGREMQW